MTDETGTVRARFGLRFRCTNCMHVMCRELISPNIEDAPYDVDELLESSLLSRCVYSCEECDNPITTLIAVKPLYDGETFDSSPKIEGTAAPSRTTNRSPGGTALTRALRRPGQRIGSPAH